MISFIKFERNWPLNVWKQTNNKSHKEDFFSFEYWKNKIKWIWDSLQEEQSTKFHQNNGCGLEPRSRSMRLPVISTCRANSIYYHTQFESNLFINVEMYANIVIFLTQLVNSCYFSYFIKSHSTIVSECSTWIASTPYHISLWSVEKCARKWSQ